MASSICEHASETAVPTRPIVPSEMQPKPGGSAVRQLPAKKSKKDQLVALIAKPNGARVSVLVERLGWQAHTVRAALSGLRKQGYQIVVSKAPKTGEAIYRIVPPEGNAAERSQEGAS